MAKIELKQPIVEDLGTRGPKGPQRPKRSRGQRDMVSSL